MKQINLEIERKWLVSKLPDDLGNYPSQHIKQGYLVIEESGAEVRLRSKDNKFFLTYKGVGDKERIEIEEEITQEFFNSFWRATKNRRVEKTRYLIQYDIFLIELDVFSGKNKGLILAEVEFDNIKKEEDFIAPKWFDKEVTKYSKYKNRNLAL